MSLRNTLTRLMRAVIEEAERNADFEKTLTDALGTTSSKRRPEKAEDLGHTSNSETKRGLNRRAPAQLDPVQVVREGELALRAALEMLSLDQLRDIVAEYGMDPGRLVMKWNTPERVIERIMEMSMARAHKGNAFRKPVDAAPASRTDAGPVEPSDAQAAALDAKTSPTSLPE